MILNLCSQVAALLLALCWFVGLILIMSGGVEGVVTGQRSPAFVVGIVLSAAPFLIMGLIALVFSFPSHPTVSTSILLLTIGCGYGAFRFGQWSGRRELLTKNQERKHA